MTLSDLEPITHVPFHGVLLPTYDITAEQRTAAAAPADCDAAAFIKQLCRAGWRTKIAPAIAKDKQQVYAERVRFELETIESLGFTNYILMVWDICRFADSAKIPRGPGRGSVASSLVAWLLDITDVDPIQEGLFFVRFLSKARAKTTVVDGVTYVDGGLVADIDMDFCYYRREEVIDYINQRYPGQTAKLLAIKTLSSKLLIKEVCKVYENMAEDEAKQISAMIEKDAGIPVSIEKSLYGDEKWQTGDTESHWPPNEQFVQWAAAHKETVELAMDLEGANHAESVHASAIAISAMPIKRLMPLQLSYNDEGQQYQTASFDMYDTQEVALKFDILGLKTLSILEDCTKATNVNWRKVDVHDPVIYRSLQDFRRRYGIFQLETWAQGSAAQKVKPRVFDQLCAVLAIARPGAIAFLDQYASFVNKGERKTVHPLIDPIIENTGFLTIYQEQYLQMLVKVQMSDDEAENARKVLGKKLKEKVPEVIAKIEEVCSRNGHPREIVDLLVKIAYDSGGYGFSKCHATAYAKLTAWTLWFKAVKPLAFYWAQLQMIQHETDRYPKLASVEQEMHALGFELLPPRLSLDSMQFQIEGDKAIRCSLGMVRGISEKSRAKLDVFIGSSGLKPDSTKFEVFQAIKNAKLNIGVGSALIQAGCLSGYDTYRRANGTPYQSRSRLVLEYTMWAKSTEMLTPAERTLCLQIGGRPEVEWDVLRAIKYLAETATDEKGKPLIKPSRYETIKRRYAPYKEIYLQNSRNEPLANLYYERRVLGYSHSQDIRDIFAAEMDGLKTIEETQLLKKDSACRLIGFVKEKPYLSKTKKGNRMLKLTLTDETGDIAIRAFNEQIDQIEERNGRLPVEQDLIIVNAKKMDGDVVFVRPGPDGNTIGIQSVSIYMNLGDLKDGKDEDSAK